VSDYVHRVRVGGIEIYQTGWLQGGRRRATKGILDLGVDRRRNLQLWERKNFCKRKKYKNKQYPILLRGGGKGNLRARMIRWGADRENRSGEKSLKGASNEGGIMCNNSVRERFHMGMPSRFEIRILMQL